MLPYSQKFENIKNKLEQNVAKLFHDLGFNFVGANYTLKSGKENIGEIDLLFTYDKFLFLIEVTSDNYGKSEKKITFFQNGLKMTMLSPLEKNMT